MADRRRYVIGAYKIPYEARDVAHEVLPHANYADAMHSNDDPSVPVGAKVTYTAELTEEEAARFRAASNVRYVVEDGVGHLEAAPAIDTADLGGVESFTRRNDCPNPGLVNGSAGCFGGTRTATNAPDPDGVQRGYVYRVNNGNSAVLPEVDAVSGETRNHSLYARANGGSATVGVQIQYYDGGSFVGATPSPTDHSVPSGQWVRVDQTDVIGTGANRARTLVNISG